MIASARTVVEEIDHFACTPRDDLLSARDREAYVLADPGREYAVYFPTGGTAALAVTDDRPWSVEWYDVEACRWHDTGPGDTSNGTVVLDAPYRKQWVANVS